MTQLKRELELVKAAFECSRKMAELYFGKSDLDLIDSVGRKEIVPTRQTWRDKALEIAGAAPCEWFVEALTNALEDAYFLGMSRGVEWQEELRS